MGQVAAWMCVLLLTASVRAQTAALFTADTEGHVTPCRSCPVHVGLGGIARRATLVASMRQRHSGLLLLDAGNFLFGPDSLESHGGVMIAAYNAIGYDAVNLSYRDFRLGLSRTLQLLHGARFDPISANLVDPNTGKPLVKPYIVRDDASGRRIAILGLTDPPAGWQQIPELKMQLAGVTVISATEALSRWLPKAAEESEDVVLLYYGSSAGLSRVQAAAGDRVRCIAVGGCQDASDISGPIVEVFPEKHGKSVAQVNLRGGQSPTLQELPVSPDIPTDRRMRELLAAFAPRGEPAK